jgi:outer membrane biosynthesis protein TonB
VSTPSILLASFLAAVAPSDRVPLAGGGSVQWDAPANACPDATTVAALIDQHLAPRGEAAVGVRVAARASEAQGGRWRIELRIETGQGASQRSLEAADCRSAAETVALAVALAVGPVAEGPPIEVPPAPERTETTDEDRQTPDPSSQTPDPSPQTPDPSPQTPDPSSQTPDPSPQTPDPSPQTPDARPIARRLAFDLALGGGLTFGHVPRLGGAAQAQVAMVGRRFQVSLRADHLIRRRLALAETTEVGGLLSFTTGALEAGPVLRPGPLELPLLAGVAVGAVRARGFGSDFDRTRTVPWAAVIIGPGVRWAPLPRLVLGLRAELSIALVRHSFTFGPDLSLVTTGLVAGHAFATIGLRLP